jgi:hypothetical protein
MKQLKSTLEDIGKLFESSITARDIAEPFSSFDANCSVADVLKLMDREDYDIIGVREDGLTSGYAIRENLKENLSGKKLGEHLILFEDEQLFTERTPIKEVFQKLPSLPKSTIFVLVLGQVGGIITRGDLQKIPVRMWLFGLISLIEMQLKRIIDGYFENDKWKVLLKEERLDKAQKFQEERKSENIDIGLVECLQLCDLRTILIKEEHLRKSLKIESRSSGKKLLKDLESLRNKLCHSQDIITGSWPKIIDDIAKAEQLLEFIEKSNLNFLDKLL